MEDPYDWYPSGSVALLCQQFLLKTRIVELKVHGINLHVSHRRSGAIYTFLEYLQGAVPAYTWPTAVPSIEAHLYHLMETHIALSSLHTHYNLNKLQVLSHITNETQWENQTATWKLLLIEAMIKVKEEFY
ncbi:hypothetical protein FRC02_002224, partial [Tulasnella sp. 418]